jgi:DNA-directed RNA polymerase subunit RPC12/RpoP
MNPLPCPNCDGTWFVEAVQLPHHPALPGSALLTKPHTHFACATCGTVVKFDKEGEPVVVVGPAGPLSRSMKIPLDPELVDLLQNYDQFVCRNCGRGCSVPMGDTPEACPQCGGTTFDNVDAPEEPN